MEKEVVREPEPQSGERSDLPSLREILQNELLDRCRRNRNYSMRAFARQMGVDQSLLSKIMRGKRPVSQKMAWHIGHALNLPVEDIEFHVRDAKESRFRAGVRFEPLSSDRIDLLSDWFNFAILELTEIESFTGEPSWIARKLGISVPEVNIALERLERLGLLDRSQWKSKQTTWSNHSYTTAARRRLQRQFLELALKSLENVDYDRRHNSSLTISVDSTLLPEIKERIRSYRHDLKSLIDQSKKKDAVYQLTIAFFPLAEAEEGGNS